MGKFTLIYDPHGVVKLSPEKGKETERFCLIVYKNCSDEIDMGQNCGNIVICNRLCKFGNCSSFRNTNTLRQLEMGIAVKYLFVIVI